MKSSHNASNQRDENLNQEAQFDDALPRALKSTAPKTNRNVTVHKEHAQTVASPYIIHLGSERNSLTSPEETISALEEQIKAQQALYLEDSELSEEEADTENLSINFQDLAAQLQEEDRPVHVVPSIEKVTTVATTAPTPVDHSIPTLSEIVEVETTTEPSGKTTTKYTRLSFQKKKMKAVAAFSALSVALILPFHALTNFTDITSAQGTILASSESGLDHILRGGNSLSSQEFDLAESNFSRAGEQFSSARAELQNMNTLISGLVSIVPETEKARSSAKNLLIAGEQFAYAGEAFTAAAADTAASSPNLSLKLSILSAHLTNALPHLEEATRAMDKVHLDSLPEDKREDIAELQAKAPAILASVQEFIGFSETLQIILGEQQSMRYLVVFQNTAELRATGGFMGSLAEVDLERGEVMNIHVPGGGTYDVQGQLTEHVAAPDPLQLINPRWELQDSNWSPDFSQAAQKMSWFYENAGGPTVDGVIAINSTVLPKLLTITGPITLEERGLTLSADNVLFELQKAKTDTPDQPKSLIAELTPALFDTLGNLEMQDLLLAADLLGSSLNQKDVQLYFKNNALQSQMIQLGWAGVQKQVEGDYLMVVDSNIGGGKTDTIIDQDVHLDVAIQENGQIINTLTITKTHNGIASTELDGLNNVDYLRVYVPKGSTLLHADGFTPPPASLFETSATPLKQDEDLLLAISNESKDPGSQTDIWNESGKTVFGNWVQTGPGKTSTITLTYALPFMIDELNEPNSAFEAAKAKLGFKNLTNYSLFVQKQSGADKRTTSASIHLPSSLKTVWSTADTSSVEFSGETDDSFNLLMETLKYD